MYMLLEMIQGGELFSVLHADNSQDGLPEAQSKFYALCVADALSYMVSFVSIMSLFLPS